MSEGVRASQRWFALLALALAAVAVALLVVMVVRASLVPILLLVLTVVVEVVATYWFLAHRGPVRWLAVALAVVTPLVLLVSLVRAGSLLTLLVTALVLALALLCGRTALRQDQPSSRMPERAVAPPLRPYLVMNPLSGGGKVGRFGLVEKAEAMGAEVHLLDVRRDEDVLALAEDAVARGADLLGVAGGDGTQALVAGVAADHGLPFLVISAGTRNHFALDLGLDREDPSTCLQALGDDAVELSVDLGRVGDRTFVNNASFGAYAAVTQSDAYRDDKRHTTLTILPDLLTGHSGSRLVARAGDVLVEHPQAVLVSVNPYGLGDVAGVGRRARLDTGRLGLVAVSVGGAVQAVGLLRRASQQGLTAATVEEVVVDADTPTIPVAVDGEALLMPAPVRCGIRPHALRVRVPQVRPGVPERTPSLSWVELRRLAFGRTARTAA